ncbi:MAG: ribonuclease III [Bacteroidetes bacterium]|nr:ribonuclease III [Bacteroidota bacterium]
MTASDSKLSEAVKNIFGYKPRNIALYKLAFRHKSAAIEINNGVKHCNERLEYLGDAVLSSIVADFLFKKFPYKDEGFLTEIRSRLVNGNNLNNLSRKLGLDKLVLSSIDNGFMGSSITGDAFEAFVGAIYLDKGYVFTQKIIVNKVLNTYMDIDDIVQKEVNFKSKIIEYTQKEKRQMEFVIAGESENGKKQKIYEVNLIIDGKVVASGKDYSIKKAEQNAAATAWEKLFPCV